MSTQILQDLLSIVEKGDTLYLNYRKERLIEKTKAISVTIHRVNLTTFASIHQEVKKSFSKQKNVVRKDLSQAQKVLDIARLRNYNIIKIFEYDLVSTSYLFDDDGFMTKPKKNDLITILEKNLLPENYVPPYKWELCPTSYIIDVLGIVRKLKLQRSEKTFGDFINIMYFLQLRMLLELILYLTVIYLRL